MNHQRTFLIKLCLLIVGFYSLPSCEEKSCEHQLETTLTANKFFAEKKTFRLVKDLDKWRVLTDNNQSLGESRFAYKIVIGPNTGWLLLNYNQLSLDNISGVLEKEFLELAKRFKASDIEEVPDVGFEIVYTGESETVDVEKISRMICLISESIDEIKQKQGSSLALTQEKISKILQPRFTFFYIDRLSIFSPIPER